MTQSSPRLLVMEITIEDDVVEVSVTPAKGCDCVNVSTRKGVVYGVAYAAQAAMSDELVFCLEPEEHEDV